MVANISELFRTTIDVCRLPHAKAKTLRCKIHHALCTSPISNDYRDEACMYRVVQKTGYPFLFGDNFGNSAPI